MTADPIASAASSERRTHGAPQRVLIMDDERDTVETLKTILVDEGFVVLGVYSGSEVLPAVRLFRPDAIVADIVVPGISGYAVAQAVRFAFTDLRRPLMIAMSGFWKERADLRVAQQVGFDHHLAKPCDPNELIRLLRQKRTPPD
jgi:CheY-like chemotaxis protein